MRDLGPSAGPEPCHCLFQKNPIISNGHVGLLLFSVFNLQHTIFPNWPLFSSAITANGHRTPCQFPQFFRIQDSLPLCERDIYLLNYLKGVGALSQCAENVLKHSYDPQGNTVILFCRVTKPQHSLQSVGAFLAPYTGVVVHQS